MTVSVHERQAKSLSRLRVVNSCEKSFKKMCTSSIPWGTYGQTDIVCELFIGYAKIQSVLTSLQVLVAPTLSDASATTKRSCHRISRRDSLSLLHGVFVATAWTVPGGIDS